MSLELEYALHVAGVARGRARDHATDHIARVLDDALEATDQLAGIPPDVVAGVVELAHSSRDCGIEGEATRWAERVHPLQFFVTTGAHQLLSPYGRGSFRLFERLGHDLWQFLRKHRRQHASWLSEEHFDAKMRPLGSPCADAWRDRHVWPFSRPDGGWLVPDGPWDKTLSASIDAFWNRWDAILNGVPALRPVQPLVVDHLRRALCWHFLVVEQEKTLPVPILPALIPGPGPDVYWLGLEDATFSIDRDFQEEIARAHRWAIDTWVARNRNWSHRGTTLCASMDDLHRSTLVLDARLAVQAWRDLWQDAPVPRVSLADRSGGMAVAIGILGLLSSPIPNAAVWASGTLAGEIADPFARRYEDSAPRLYDGWLGWPGTVSAETRKAVVNGLVSKFAAARAHGTAHRVLIPTQLGEDVIAAFAGEIAKVESARVDSGRGARAGVVAADEGEELVALRLHPVTVPKVSNAGDAYLPTSFRKFRYVNAPDLRWAFSKYDRSGRTRGHFDRIPCDDVGAASLLSAMKAHSAVCVQGPPRSGKSYAIANALSYAREQLGNGNPGRTGPRVTFIRYPTFMRSKFEGWVMILTHLGFPRALVEEFLHAGTIAEAARIFVFGLREHGPDVTVIGGLDSALEDDREPTPTRDRHRLRPLIESIAKELTREPVLREEAVARVLGGIELVVESAVGVPEGTVAWTLPQALPWARAPEVRLTAWGAVMDVARSTSGGDLLLDLVEALSFFQGEFGANGLYAAARHARVPSDPDPAVGALTRMRLAWTGSRFAIHDRPGHAVPGLDTGPLLREAQGRFHIHPLVRDAAYDAHSRRLLRNEDPPRRLDFDARHGLARFHYAIAVEILCPQLDVRQVAGPLEAAGTATRRGSHDAYLYPGAPGPTLVDHYLPERVAEAEWHLRQADQYVRIERARADIEALSSRITQSTMMLLRYFRDSSIGIADYMKDFRVFGPLASNKVGFAYLHATEYIERSRGIPHSTWFTLRAQIAEKLGESDIPGRSPLELALGDYLRATEQVGQMPQSERHYLATSTKANVIAFVLRYASTPGFPFGHRVGREYSLGIGAFVGSELEQTWNEIASRNDPVDPAFLTRDPILGDVYTEVGDAYWREHRHAEAQKIYLLGNERMRSQHAPRRYYQLEIRAAGATLELGSAALGPGFDRTWWLGLRQKFSPRPNTDAITVHFVGMLDEHFGYQGRNERRRS